jgi:hypothetical protein
MVREKDGRVTEANVMTKTDGRKSSTDKRARGGLPVPVIVLVLCTVLLAGYLVMALEILAFRIVQIYFGTAIYATGAVLGVVLAALTLGYWMGGNLSVRYRATRVQAGSLIVAGLWIFAMAGIPRPIGAVFQSRENPQGMKSPYLTPPWKTIPQWILDHPASESIEVRMRLDPLVGSIILFAVPSFLLATVGPCAIRILTRKAEQAGPVSGRVFALGSLGSIAGVLVTSFWLIALAGISANLRLVGVVAFALGLLVFCIRNVRQ